MAERSLALRWHDIVQAIARIDSVIQEMSIDAFEADWQARWVVERGVEVVSEASRHLNDDLKARHPHIPWPKVAGIGNILRHDYERISAPVMWTLAQADLAALAKVCREELQSLP